MFDDEIVDPSPESEDHPLEEVSPEEDPSVEEN